MKKLVEFAIGMGVLAALVSGVTILGACTVGVVNSVIKECKRKSSLPESILIKQNKNSPSPPPPRPSIIIP